MKKVISVIFIVIAVNFFYSASFFSFLNIGNMVASQGSTLVSSSSISLIVTIIQLVFAFIALIIGLAIKKFQGWRRTTGIVLLTSAGIALFVALSTYSTFQSSAFREVMSKQKLDLTLFDFNIGPGLLMALVYILIGYLLFLQSKEDAPPQEEQPNQPVSSD